MPSWHDILNQITQSGSTFDVVRRQYINELSTKTGRNTILYYSGWLQKPGVQGTEVNDSDKNGFMAVIYQLDRSKGLDLILHTPGGEVAATESLIDYLRYCATAGHVGGYHDCLRLQRDCHGKAFKSWASGSSIPGNSGAWYQRRV